MVRYRDHAGRLAAAGDSSPLFVGLARARFGFGLAASGVSASRKKGFDGKGLLPRKGGARFYVVNGMAREATQELGRWKPPAAMEALKSRPLNSLYSPGRPPLCPPFTPTKKKKKIE